MPRDAASWGSWRQSLKRELEKALGIPRLPSPRPPLTVETLEAAVDCGTYTRERVLLHDGALYRLPCFVLTPRGRGGGGLGAVAALPGHGYGSRDAVGLTAEGLAKPVTEGYQKHFAAALAERGLLVVVPELLGFGDRQIDSLAGKGPGENSCQKLGCNLLLLGETLAAWRVFDTWCALDYAAGLDAVDKNHLAVMGVSGGGMVAALAAALDEGISAAVVSCYGGLFADSIMAQRHCIDNYIPGILRYAELPDIFALIAPRPLFIEAAVADHLFPVASSRTAFDYVSRGYGVLGAAANIGVDIFEGGHGIGGAAAFDWLAGHLRG